MSKKEEAVSAAKQNTAKMNCNITNISPILRIRNLSKKEVGFFLKEKYDVEFTSGIYDLPYCGSPLP